MKRTGNLFDKIISIENLQLADKKAQRGKKNRKHVKIHNQNKEDNIWKLHNSLKDGTYKTSEYCLFTIYEPKERKIAALPYYPDRVAQHAILNVLEPIFTNCFIAQTYSCIRGRGIHKCLRGLTKALRSGGGGGKLHIAAGYQKVL